MELIFKGALGIASFLIFAVIVVPLFRLSSRILAIRTMSFGATYLLVLIVCGSLIIADIIVSPLLSSSSMAVQLVISSVLSFGVSGWVIGYFVTTEDRKSIGWAKGTKLVFLANILFAVTGVLLGATLSGIFSAMH